MNFWIIAVVLLIISAAAFCWPLFAGSTRDRVTSLLILLVIPAGLVVFLVIRVITAKKHKRRRFTKRRKPRYSYKIKK
jgi:cytochrome bd-type quinol oxidase subunit 2